MRVFNFNEEIRIKLALVLYKTKNSDNLYNEIFEYLTNMKVNNENVYKTILGIMFCDTYVSLNYRQKENRLSENDENNLNIYNKLIDIDDLIFFVEEHPEHLINFYSNSVKFHTLSEKTKIEYLYAINNACLSYLSNFSKTIRLEKECYFGNITAIDLLGEYNEYIEKNKDKLNTKTLFIDIGIKNFCDKLNVLSYGNNKAYQNILISLLRTFYIWKSFLRKNFPDLLDKEDLKILNIIENNDINDIFYTNSLINHIVTEYIYFYTTESTLDKKEMEEYFNNNSSDKMKIKLKEV